MVVRIVACVSATALLGGAAAARTDEAGVRAKQTVRAIAVLGPRVAGSANELRAGRVVRARFARLGLRPVVQRVPLPRGGSSRNLVFRTGGGPLRAIVVAHLDGVSAGPAANDNGSGVGALVEVARALAGTPGVLYAALGAEEQVMTGSSLHLGSARLLRSLTAGDRRTVRVALSLDMVANGPELNVRGLEVHGPNRSARAAFQPRGSSGAGTTAGTRRATVSAGWTRQSSRRRSASRCEPFALPLPASRGPGRGGRWRSPRARGSSRGSTAAPRCPSRAPSRGRAPSSRRLPPARP